MKYIFLFSLLCLCVFSCTTAKRISNSEPISKLTLIGSIDLPHNLAYNNTTVGGLSGIDYDAKKDEYYLICDDRSAINPARFYTARIFFQESSVDSVRFTGVHFLKQINGAVYPSSKQDPAHTPDPEALRLMPGTSNLVWTSEGERIVRKEGVVLEDPSIIMASRDGDFRDSFVLPANLHMQTEEKGPRQNGVFEGLTFLNKKRLMVSIEEPLYEDGPRAGLDDSSALIRLVVFDVKTRKQTGQFGYRIDPVAHAPVPPGAFRINGVPDILALNENQLLVMERSFSTGVDGCTIKIYLADLHDAENIMTLPYLFRVPFHEIRKKLLLNMDDLGMYIDNVEGMTLGPKLADGRQTLVLVADNNFSKEEKTQFFVFAF